MEEPENKREVGLFTVLWPRRIRSNPRHAEPPPHFGAQWTLPGSSNVCLLPLFLSLSLCLQTFLRVRANRQTRLNGRCTERLKPQQPHSVVSAALIQHSYYGCIIAEPWWGECWGDKSEMGESS